MKNIKIGLVLLSILLAGCGVKRPNIPSGVATAGNYTAALTQVSGNVVHRQTIADSDETVALEHLPAGVYIMRLEKNGRAATIRVAKK